MISSGFIARRTSCDLSGSRARPGLQPTRKIARSPGDGRVDSGLDLTDHRREFSTRDETRNGTIDQVSPHPLWIGHAGDGSDSRRLFDVGVEAVVQVAAEEPPLSPPRDLISLRFPLVDGSGNPPSTLRLAVAAVAGLIRLGVPTLVCCGMGLSRSPAVAAVALALVRGEAPDDVLRSLSDRRPVDISPGFWREIRMVRPLAIDLGPLPAERSP